VTAVQIEQAGAPKVLVVAQRGLLGSVREWVSGVRTVPISGRPGHHAPSVPGT